MERSYYSNGIEQLTYNDAWYRAGYFARTSRYKTGIEFLDNDLWSGIPLE